MIIKAFTLGIALATTPLVVVSMQDDKAPRRVPKPVEIAPAQDDGMLEAVRNELRQAREEVRDLRQQLQEALDLLDDTVQPQREQRRNCTPSRSALSYYQWLHQRGHGARAQRTFDRYVEQLGDDRRRLSSLARELLTDDDHAGRFDQAALALVQRAQRGQGDLSHRDLDTAALAHFLNGNFAEAVALAKQAAQKSRGSDDYRRRLRTYEVALARLAGATEPAADRLAAR